MLGTRTLFETARVVIGFLLMTQAAFVIAACGWMERSPAIAVQHAAAAELPPCHEPAPVSSEGPLCLSHCLESVQSLDKPSFAVAVLPAAPVLVVVARPVFVSGMSAAQEPPAGPPLRILFQSLQI